jgi:tryptase
LTPRQRRAAPHDAATDGGPQGVLGGAGEPNYLHPWVADLITRGCQGTLIDPQWVLTAAHCLGTASSHTVEMTRTDPLSGETRTQSRTPSDSGLFKPLDFVLGNEAHDIALIRLPAPFEITPGVQTVALPTGPRNFSPVGTVASIDHGGTLPAGQLAIFRARIPDGAGPSFTIFAADAGGAHLYTGDSGSGLVSVEGGRAVVRGVASLGGDCPPLRDPSFTDVFFHRDWILSTMAKSAAELAGNTRVRWTGRGARGQIGLGCLNPAGTMWGPTNVVGVELAALCEAGQT